MNVYGEVISFVLENGKSGSGIIIDCGKENEVGEFVKENGLFAYSTRGCDDDPGMFGTMEHLGKVFINRAGTFITDTEMLDSETEYINIDDWDYTGEEMIMSEYAAMVKKRKEDE